MCDTALPGTPLHTLLNRRNYRRFAVQATDWLLELARCTRRADGPSGADGLADAVADFTAAFGPVLEPSLRARAEALASSLRVLPRVCEHRDFGPWNVFVTRAGDLAVYDWESSEPVGLAGLDLHYFLTYLAFAFDGARRTPAMLRSYTTTLDPTTFTGSVAQACLRRYADGVGMDVGDFDQAPLLAWMIHARAEHRRLTADAVAPPSPAALEQSLFLGLWRAEVLKVRARPS